MGTKDDVSLAESSTDTDDETTIPCEGPCDAERPIIDVDSRDEKASETKLRVPLADSDANDDNMDSDDRYIIEAGTENAARGPFEGHLVAERPILELAEA